MYTGGFWGLGVGRGGKGGEGYMFLFKICCFFFLSSKDVITGTAEITLESIQGTCRLSLKMGKGDEQKPLMHCIRR